MSVRITVRKNDDVTILDLEGRIILGPAADSVTRALQDLIAKGVRKIVLNMSGIQQVDTSGISTVVRSFVSIQRLGGTIVLACLSDRVRMVLDMTRLLNV